MKLASQRTPLSVSRGGPLDLRRSLFTSSHLPNTQTLSPAADAIAVTKSTPVRKKLVFSAQKSTHKVDPLVHTRTAADKHPETHMPLLEAVSSPMPVKSSEAS